MPDWETIYANTVFRVQTACAPTNLMVRVEILGDPAVYVGGVQSEWRTEILCVNSASYVTFVDHLAAERDSADYDPSGQWAESISWGGQTSTQTLEYRELPEADPEGDYEVTYTGRVSDVAVPPNLLAEHSTSFKMTRAVLVEVLDHIASKLRACCLGKVGMGRTRHGEGRPA